MRREIPMKKVNKNYFFKTFSYLKITYCEKRIVDVSILNIFTMPFSKQTTRYSPLSDTDVLRITKSKFKLNKMFVSSVFPNIFME